MQVPIITSDFNSIKVRLERHIELRTPSVAIFQFHKGAIRTAPPGWWMMQTAISIP